MNKNLIWISLFGSITSANYFVIVDGADEKYIEENFTTEVTYSNWVDVGEEECTYDLTADEIYYGYTSDQNIFCTLEQTRVKTTTITYDSGGEQIRTENESQTIERNEILTITGTHLEDSCLNILNFNNQIPTGINNLANIDNSPYEVYCDMDTNGGGWIRLDNSAILNDAYAATGNHFSGKTTWIDDKLIYGDVSVDLGHDRSFTLNLPFNYQEFYLKDYKAKSYTGVIETGEDITNFNWNTEVVLSGGWGDIAFGSRDLSKPTMSYSQQGEYSQITGEIPFPNENVYSLGTWSNKFTVRSVEAGGQGESLYIWNSGYVYLR